MTHHNIAGNEVGTRPLTYVREIRPSRPIGGRILWLIAPPAGVLAFGVDQLVGFPLCAGLVVVAFIAWILKPERQ